MKAGWQVKPLAAVSKLFADGDWIESKDQSADGVRLVQTGNVGEGFFKDRGEKARYISKETFVRLRCTEIFEGDCLVSRLPDPVGRSCLLPDTGERMITAVDCTIVRFDSSQFLPDFFVYYTQSSDYLNNVNKETSGTTRKRISRSKLAEISIPVPPIEQQQRIVAILDQAFEGIAKARANAEQNLQNARALFESHLQSVFTQRGEGWVEKELQDLVDANCSLSYGIVQPGEEFSNGLPIIRPTDLTSKFITLDGLKLIDPKLATSYKRTTLIGNELLLCVRGSTGIISIATIELKGSNVTRGIVPIRFNPELISQEFGYYLLISSCIQEQIKSKTYGTALMQINIGDLRKIATPFPNLKIQQNLVAKLNELSKETKCLETLYQRKIALLDELKKSLLQQAFAGEL